MASTQTASQPHGASMMPLWRHGAGLDFTHTHLVHVNPTPTVIPTHTPAPLKQIHTLKGLQCLPSTQLLRPHTCMKNQKFAQIPTHNGAHPLRYTLRRTNLASDPTPTHTVSKLKIHYTLQDAQIDTQRLHLSLSQTHTFTHCYR